MSLKVDISAQFKKDLKRIEKRGWDTKLLSKVIRMLANEEQLPVNYRDHNLTGNWISCRECHIKGDYLLIYRVHGDTLYLVRVGSHSDLRLA